MLSVSGTITIWSVKMDDDENILLCWMEKTLKVKIERWKKHFVVHFKSPTERAEKCLQAIFISSRKSYSGLTYMIHDSQPWQKKHKSSLSSVNSIEKHKFQSSNPLTFLLSSLILFDGFVEKRDDKNFSISFPQAHHSWFIEK